MTRWEKCKKALVSDLIEINNRQIQFGTENDYRHGSNIKKL